MIRRLLSLAFCPKGTDTRSAVEIAIDGKKAELVELIALKAKAVRRSGPLGAELVKKNKSFYDDKTVKKCADAHSKNALQIVAYEEAIQATLSAIAELEASWDRAAVGSLT